MQQIRYNGIVEAVRISRAGFPIRFLNDEYEKKYWYVKDDDLVLPGKTRVFLTQGNYDVLELRRKTREKYFVISIQKNVRKYIAQKKYHILLKKPNKITINFRMIIKYKRFQKIIKNNKSLIIQRKLEKIYT